MKRPKRYNISHKLLTSIEHYLDNYVWFSEDFHDQEYVEDLKKTHAEVKRKLKGK